MRPIATIILDTPDSASTVRGIVYWSPSSHRILIEDPRGTVTADPEAPAITSLEDALDYIRRAWGFDSAAWDLQWLCEDPSDYGAH